VNNISAFYDPEYTDYVSCFSMMVKSGELYARNEATSRIDEKGLLQGTPARPRAIMAPAPRGYGIMQALQKDIFPHLRRRMPGFIHAMTGEKIVEQVKSKIGSKWHSLSIDGSSFDSS